MKVITETTQYQEFFQTIHHLSHVIAILEWLVSKRLARTIYFTRLPTGHTHEDIDAIFKLLWQCFRSRHIESLVAYSASLEEAFKNSVLKPKVGKLNHFKQTNFSTYTSL